MIAVNGCLRKVLISRIFIYMALSHKEWELPTWLAENNTDHNLDFPIKTNI